MLLLKRILYFLILCLLLNCTQKQSNQAANTSIEEDSVFSLITQGGNTNIPTAERKLLLQNAYESAIKISNDSLQFLYFSKLSNAYLKLKDSLLFRTLNLKSQQLAIKKGDSIALAEVYWDLATFYKNSSVSDKAYANYKKASQIYISIDSTVHAGRMHYNMAFVQSMAKDYTGAEVNLVRAVELLKPKNEFKRLYNCYNLLGISLDELGQYDQALDYYGLATNSLQQMENPNKVLFSQIQNNIGNVHKKQSNYRMAIPYYQNALKSDSLLTKRPDKYALYLGNLASCRFKIADTAGVKLQLQQALALSEEILNISGISRGHYNLAEYELAYSNKKNALEHAIKSRVFAKQSGNNKRLMEALRLLSKIDKDNNERYFENYLKLNDSLVQEERSERDKFARIRFETDEVSAKNVELTRQRQIWTGVAIAVFLMGVAVYVIINQRSKNLALRFQQQQQASNQEIFDLMLAQKQKIEDTKKKEQKRISEELHDGVLGKMLGARMVLTGLNKRDTEEAINERAIAIVALKDVEGEIRAISHELSHAAYQNINNFINSIQELLDTIGSANHIAFTFNFDEKFDWDSMSGDLKINLYRIIQESLQNAVKHAECNTILVSFVRANNNLKVIISDDGKGFKPKSGKKGIGMRNIESRVDKLNGTWNLTSVIGQGTTINIEVPI